MIRFHSQALSGIVHSNGQIQRTDVPVAPSDSWVCIGAVEYLFGHIARRFTLSEILAGDVSWTYQNGKQRAFLLVVDHGATVVMLAPRMYFTHLSDQP